MCFRFEYKIIYLDENLDDVIRPEFIKVSWRDRLNDFNLFIRLSDGIGTEQDRVNLLFWNPVYNMYLQGAFSRCLPTLNQFKVKQGGGFETTPRAYRSEMESQKVAEVID